MQCGSVQFVCSNHFIDLIVFIADIPKAAT